MTIQSPLGWVWERVRLSAHGIGSAPPAEYWARADRPAPTVRRIGLADLRAALAAGLADFAAVRTDVMFLCVVYPVVGLLLWRLAAGGFLPLLFPLASGFALIGPVAAIGINELSRRREQGDVVRWVDAFGVLHSPAIGSIVLLGLLLVVLFLLWLVAAGTIYQAIFGAVQPASLAAFARDVLGTPAGWRLTVLGIGVGFVFALVVLAISVVSFPLLLDRDVGVEMAVRTSIRAVAANPGPMAAWGLIIAGLLALGSLPFLLGLVVVMPVLGHATWHLYRRLVV